MVIETSHFDIAEHLETEDDIREFLAAAAASGDPSDFIHALGTAARARGMLVKNRLHARDSRAALSKQFMPPEPASSALGLCRLSSKKRENLTIMLIWITEVGIGEPFQWQDLRS